MAICSKEDDAVEIAVPISSLPSRQQMAIVSMICVISSSSPHTHSQTGPTIVPMILLHRESTPRPARHAQPNTSSAVLTNISNAHRIYFSSVFGLAPFTRMTKRPPTNVLVNMISPRELIRLYTSLVTMLAYSASQASTVSSAFQRLLHCADLV